MRKTEQTADHSPEPGAPSDEELMARFQQGDAAALEQIIDRHGQRLLGWLTRMVGSRDRAEDAYQETFLRVIRAARGYRSSDRFGAWLYTIARNVTVDLARRQKFRAVESLDRPAFADDDLARIETVADPGADPEENLRGREMADAIEKAMAGLAPEQREVLLLRERANLSFKEIARMTGAPLNTVKTRMHYALGHLRKQLESQGWMGGE